jgi:23S rRNA (adenine2503-C2)-methyltransferase
LVADFAAAFTLPLPHILSAHQSGYDKSVKFLLELADGAQVESVLMPESRRITLCVSSQVGCAQGCVFCHTGRMGLKRNLSAGEIVGQVVLADRWLRQNPGWLDGGGLAPLVGMRVTNLVFMGMGEPLDNTEAVADAVRILVDPYGLALGLRRVSVSTAGHLDGIERISALIPGVRLALSVHSVDDAKRSRIMPINRRWPLAEVVARLRALNSDVLFQYTMIQGVNDSTEEAERLVELTRGLDAKVNLIPLNPVGPSRLVAPAAEAIQAFRDVLHRAGIRVMVRYSKGQDIAAACGQLVVAQNAKIPRQTVHLSRLAAAPGTALPG